MAVNKRHSKRTKMSSWKLKTLLPYYKIQQMLEDKTEKISWKGEGKDSEIENKKYIGSNPEGSTFDPWVF